MFNGKYVKIEHILEKVFRDYKFNTDIDWVDAIEWIGECIDLIGVPNAYIEKVTDGNTELFHPDPITIVDYKGKLPTDIHQLRQARECENNTPMRRTTDTFFMSYYCEESSDNACDSCTLTYKVSQDYIFTSFETGTVELSYLAFPTDDRGYPLIPDMTRYKKAVTLYIAEKLAFRLLLQERLNINIYREISTERDWYMGSAETAMKIPDYDTMEGWKNMFTRLIPDVQAHGSFYRYIGDQEQRFNNSYNR